MYRVRAKVGTDLEGKPIYKNFYGDGKVEAERKRDTYLQSETQLPYSTLGQLAQFYTYNILINEPLAEATISLYEAQYRLRIKDSALAIKPIAEVTPIALQEYLNSLDIVPSAMRALGKYLRRLFNWVSKQGYCPNHMYSVTIPATKPKTGDISVFSDTEVKRITTTQGRFRVLFSLALATGLRASELLALRYSDIKDVAIHVTRQLNEIYDIDPSGYRQLVFAIRETKSITSNRIVPIPQTMQTELEQHKAWHLQEQKENGYTTDYIFTTDTGGYIYKSNLRRSWQRHLSKAGVPYKKFHACRATYCTLLCKSGVPLEMASKLMGHSDLTVTAKFYRLVTAEEMVQAVEKINDLF